MLMKKKNWSIMIELKSIYGSIERFQKLINLHSESIFTYCENFEKNIDLFSLKYKYMVYDFHA